MIIEDAPKSIDYILIISMVLSSRNSWTDGNKARVRLDKYRFNENTFVETLL